MSMTRANVFKVVNQGGMSITNRLNPIPYTDIENSAIILKNLNKKGIEILKDEKLCICGSGKDAVDCHKSVSNNSLVYLVWEKYLAYDDEVKRQSIENNVVSYCKMNNCNKCCNEYFYISASEYFLIKNHIIETKGQEYFYKLVDKGRSILEELKENNEEEFKKLDNKDIDFKEMYNDKENIYTFIKCPLLNEDGLCDCYSARPLICRFYGTSYLYNTCAEIKEYFTEKVSESKLEKLKKLFLKKQYNKKYKERYVNCVKKHMVEIAFDGSYQNNIDIIKLNEEKYIIQRGYPLFYYLANDKLFERGYILAISTTPEEYALNQVGVK